MNIPVDPKAVERLTDMHYRYGKRDIQTIRGGTQVGLDGCPFEEVKALVARLAEAVGSPIDNAWSIRMHKGGKHLEHNHPKGRLSGVYYLCVGKGGDLVLNGRHITPEPGMLVTFPSWLPHSTTEYEGEEPRLTVAFDVA